MGIDASAPITTSVLEAYTNRRVEPIYRSSVLMGALKSHGKLTFNHAGKNACTWYPKFRRRAIEAGDGNPVSISFPETNVRRECKLDWKNYNMGASNTKFTQLVSSGNSGAGAKLFNVVEELAGEMTDDFMEDFRLKLYKDGNAAGSKDVHGLESIFSYNGLLTGSKVGDPNDSYAGHTTNLGVTGEWDPDSVGDIWPLGTGETEYHWWSPMIVDYQNGGFSGSSNTWKLQWQEALNYLCTYLGVLQKKDVDLILLHPELKRLAQDSLIDLHTFEVTQNSPLTKLGHKTLQYNGIEIASEYGVPNSGWGYALNFEHMELRSLQNGLLGTMNDKDISIASDLKALDFYGQFLMWAPSFFGKLVPITALGT